MCRKARTRWVRVAEPLIPTAAPSSLPRERVRERVTSRKACIGAVRVLGKIAEIRGMPSPQPFPTEEGVGCSRFCEFWRFERQLKFAAVDCRSSEKQKAACTDVFFEEPLIPTATPSSLPWERVRERVTSRKACIWGCEGVGKDCCDLENALSPTLPHGGGSGLQQILRFQVI